MHFRYFQFQAIQFIIASFESSATYVIRIYSQSLPPTYMSHIVSTQNGIINNNKPVYVFFSVYFLGIMHLLLHECHFQAQITYKSESILRDYYTSLTPEDVAGRRHIFDVSKPANKGENLTVVEEGKNCNIFLC